MLQWSGRLRPWLEKDMPLGADEDGLSMPAAHAAALWRWIKSIDTSLAGPVGVGEDP